MKRAEAKVVGASFFQLHKWTHDLHDVDAAEYLLYGILWDQAKENEPVIYGSLG